MSLLGNETDSFAREIVDKGLNLNSNYGNEIRLGRVPGISSYSILAHNPNITTTEKAFAPQGTGAPDVTFMATAKKLQISSDNANDTSAGTGARTVLVTFLDSNFDEQTEVIILNGQTGVISVGTAVAVNRIQVISTGSTGSNVGIIFVTDEDDTLTAGEPDTRVHNCIEDTWNLSYCSHYTVPRNHTFIPIKYSITCDADNSKPMNIKVFTNVVFGLPEFTLNHFYFSVSISDYDLPAIIALQEKSTWRSTVFSSSGTNEATNFVQGYLVNLGLYNQ